MTQFGRRGRLSPQVSAGRRAVEHAVKQSLGRAPQPTDRVFVALSGGPDSLALAAAAAHFHRRHRLRVGVVVVDHQLQEGSDLVARRTVQQACDLGLDPVELRTVAVRRDGEGLEAAARHARYAALIDVCSQYGAHAVLLGHTRDDQAETVLLRLARGSGTRALAGMSMVSVRDGLRVVRPFLGLTRDDTTQICAAEQLQPWWDPTNTDESFLRARVRHTVLPMLERELGPGVAASLARTAAIVGPDADELDRQAEQLLHYAQDQVALEQNVDRTAADGDRVVLSLKVLHQAAPALLHRTLARACILAGGQAVSSERLGALAELARGRGESGPVQMAGKVSVYRRRPTSLDASGTLEFWPTT